MLVRPPKVRMFTLESKQCLHTKSRFVPPVSTLFFILMYQDNIFYSIKEMHSYHQYLFPTFSSSGIIILGLNIVTAGYLPLHIKLTPGLDFISTNISMFQPNDPDLSFAFCLVNYFL